MRTIRGLESGAIKRPHPSTVAALAGPLRLQGRDLTTFTQAWLGFVDGPLSLAEMLQRNHVVCALTDALEKQSTRLREIIKICDSVIDAEGRLAQITVTRTFEVLLDGVDRVIWIQNFDPHTMRPGDIRTTGLANCRTGNAVALSDTVLGHEMLLGTPIGVGETFMISYCIDLRDAYLPKGDPVVPEIESLTGTAVGVAVYIEQVRFTAPRVPSMLWEVSQRSLSEQSPPQRSLKLNPFGVAQIVLERPQPGVHGIRWSWDGEQAP